MCACVCLFSEQIGQEIAIVVRAHTHTHMSSSFYWKERERGSFLAERIIYIIEAHSTIERRRVIYLSSRQRIQSMLKIYFICLIFNIQSKKKKRTAGDSRWNDLDILAKNDEFVCPKDGRWPHPLDCEKYNSFSQSFALRIIFIPRYYTCTSGISIEGW